MNKTIVLLGVLTFVNAGLLAYQVFAPAGASRAGTHGVLRGSGLEIYDEQGVLRAQLKVEPGNPTYRMPDGEVGYPETVIFRLITADGKPRVKLTTSTPGSALMLLGATDTTRTVLHALDASTSLILRNDEDEQRVLGP
jgi:hypothetical protein